MMDARVSLFEQAIRRMLEHDLFHDDARRLLWLIEAVTKPSKLSGVDLQAELRTHTFLLILKLSKHQCAELVTPYLSDLANTPRIPGYIAKVTSDLMPVVEKLTFDPCRPTGNQRPSWSSSTPPNACS